jgi:hypothetical protein
MSEAPLYDGVPSKAALLDGVAAVAQVREIANPLFHHQSWPTMEIK